MTRKEMAEINFFRNGSRLAQKVADVLVEEYERALDQFGKIATKETIESLRSQFEVDLANIKVEVLASIVLLYIENGRRAGAKMPPQGALDDWYRARGIDPKLDYVIRRSIAKKGIKPTPIGEYVLDNARPRLEALYQEYLSKEALSEMTNSLKVIYKGI